MEKSDNHDVLKRAYAELEASHISIVVIESTHPSSFPYVSLGGSTTTADPSPLPVSCEAIAGEYFLAMQTAAGTHT